MSWTRSAHNQSEPTIILRLYSRECFKQTSLKGCHQGQNLAVLAFLERLQFTIFFVSQSWWPAIFFCVPWPLHFEIRLTGSVMGATLTLQLVWVPSMGLGSRFPLFRYTFWWKPNVLQHGEILLFILFWNIFSILFWHLYQIHTFNNNLNEEEMITSHLMCVTK